MPIITILTKNWGKNFTGATLATQQLAERWAMRFVRIEVLTLHAEESISANNLTVTCIRPACQLCGEIKKKEADGQKRIWYSDDHLGFLLAVQGIEYYHTYHGNWPDARSANAELFIKSLYFMPAYEATMRHAKAVICVSHYMERYALRFNPHTLVIHNGMDKKAAYVGPPPGKTFLMVGTISKRKYEMALPLLKQLWRLDPEIQVHIYGAPVEQSVVQDLQGMPNVIMEGQQQAIPYKAYRGLIHTSKMENLSIAVCEAIDQEIPVFCFAVGGLPEVVIQGRTGMLFEMSAVEKMAQSIAEQAAQRKPMKADRYILEDFSWDQAAESYCRLFLQDNVEGG